MKVMKIVKKIHKLKSYQKLLRKLKEKDLGKKVYLERLNWVNAYLKMIKLWMKVSKMRRIGTPYPKRAVVVDGVQST